jgi:hypothetical protein
MWFVCTVVVLRFSVLWDKKNIYGKITVGNLKQSLVVKERSKFLTRLEFTSRHYQLREKLKCDRKQSKRGRNFKRKTR